MRHVAYLFIGDDLKQCARGVEQNVHLREGRDIRAHFSSLVWLPDKDDKGKVAIVEAQANEANGSEDTDAQPVLKTLTEIDIRKNGDELTAFFRNFFATHVVVGSAGGDSDMLITLVLPGFDEDMKAQAAGIVTTLNSAGLRCIADLLLLAPDLDKAFMEDSKRIEETDRKNKELTIRTVDNAKELLRLKPSCPLLHHVMVIENRNENGTSLNLDEPTLARILSEYAVTTLENYTMLYNQSVEFANEDKITTFGLSCLDFNRRYFTHYLLHHAYERIMENEQVMQTEVDINKVSDIAENCLRGHEHVASDFYNQYVAPELSAGKTPETIVNEIRPKLDGFVKDLEARMLSCMTDDTLSLPEKRAVLAQILVLDDDLLTGSLYDTRRLTFIDILKEPIDYFVAANNRNMTFEEDEDGNPVYDEDGHRKIRHTVLQRPLGNDSKIWVPVEMLKQLRIKIREASEYIRRQEQALRELTSLNKEADKSDIVVTDKDGLDFTHYRLLNEGGEQPLAEDYKPADLTAERNIDLSPDFTGVKDQGTVGSCSVFAVTAVFEYILRKNRQADYDLSERFVYYNVRRDHEGLGSEGSAISHVIESIGKEGVCLEKECPYDVDHYNEEPAAEAYDEASQRRIVKALNVPVTEDVNANINLLRTAIADGYPVVIGLEIFDHLKCNNGFVPMPDEQSVNDGAHAMVVCGYDDDAMLFKVRNSWGTRFGRQGYCFIPYAYLGQKQYLDCAYIITEISTADVVKGIVDKHTIAFDKSDTIIKQAVISSLIASKKLYQADLEQQYRAVYADFVYLSQTLCDKQVRDDIMEDEEKRLKDEQHSARLYMNVLETGKGQKLQEHTSQTARSLMVAGVACGFFLLVAAVCYFGFNYHGEGLWTSLVLAVLTVFYMIGYRHNRTKDYKHYKDELDEEIKRQAGIVGKYNRQIAELKMRMFTYGMVLQSLSSLHNNLVSYSNALKSYVNNLAAWYHQEHDKIQHMDATEHVPFIALCDNGVLDAFFNNHAGELTEGIKLYDCMQQGHYTLDAKRIMEFRQGLRDTIQQRLEHYLEGFNMYDYVNSVSRYPYLSDSNAHLRPLLQNTMQPYSKVMLSQVNADTAFTNIFIKYNEGAADSWLSLCRTLCGGSPQCGVTNSPDKLLVVQIAYVEPDNVNV